MPIKALLLGVAGLIPFAGLSGAMAFAPSLAPAGAWQMLVSYAAIILSFMGGVHWGLALRQAEGTGYLAAVLPALWAWAAIAFLQPRPALGMIAAGFLALLIFDLYVIRAGGAPQWYKHLRIGLTAVVVGSVVIVLAATM